jgi:hypothetical protein
MGRGMKPLDPEIRAFRREEIPPLFASASTPGSPSAGGAGNPRSAPEINFAGEQAAKGQRANGSPTASCLSGKAESGRNALRPLGVQCETVGQVSGQSENRDAVTLDCEASRRDASLPTDKARARRKDRQTSHDAAASVVNLGRTRDAILELFQLYGCMTDEQLAAKYQYERSYLMAPSSPSGLRSRRSELVKRFGFIKACTLGQSHAGNPSIVWEITQSGREYLRKKAEAHTCK